MTTLTWQTLLLLAISYFAGCCLGCLARRSAWRRRAPPETAQSHAHAAPLAGTASIQPVPDRSMAPVPAAAIRAAAVVTPQTAREPFRRADAPASQPKPATDVPGAVADAARTAARFERVLEAGGEGTRQPQPAAPAAGGADDDLKRIRAIDAALETRLKALGVGTFSHMAQWTAADTARISRELGFKGRIGQENWIEQAQILARGGDTRYSRRLARGEAAAARPIEDEGEPRAPAVPRAPTVPERPVAQAGEKAPSDAGVSSPHVSDRAAFAQSRPPEAAFSRDYDRRASAGQTQVTPRGGDEHAIEAGGGRASDLAALRSVRSEAYRTGRDAAAARAHLAEPDDLKRIRGVGVLIEKRLNGLGVTTYEHIANWTAADIDRVSQVLDFKGRIARENWVEQARILASGGQTEFSRRIDRGRMASSGGG